MLTTTFLHTSLTAQGLVLMVVHVVYAVMTSSRSYPALLMMVSTVVGFPYLHVYLYLWAMGISNYGAFVVE